MTLINISIPVIMKSAASVRSLKIDVTIETTNRSTLNLVRKYEFELRDHLYSTIKPFQPQFLLTPEGRNNMIGKIKNELNAKLESLQSSGKVKYVYLDEMLGD